MVVIGAWADGNGFQNQQQSSINNIFIAINAIQKNKSQQFQRSSNGQTREPAYIVGSGPTTLFPSIPGLAARCSRPVASSVDDLSRSRLPKIHNSFLI